jgi:hypothetical protein
LKISQYLKDIPAGRKPGQKSDELQQAEEFATDYLSDPSDIQSKEPCTRFGDLLIALESEHIPNFYTMNAKESQHLCRVLQQTLIVRPPNPIRLEVECPKEDAEWPYF